MKLFTKKTLPMITTENKEKTIEDIKTLNRIALLLTPMSQELFKLTKKPPTTTHLVDIAFAIFHKDRIVKMAVLELTHENFLPPVRDSLRQTQNEFDFNRTLGKILSMGKVLGNYSKSIYSPLILEHLRVNKMGIVELPKSQHKRIKESNTN